MTPGDAQVALGHEMTGKSKRKSKIIHTFAITYFKQEIIFDFPLIDIRNNEVINLGVKKRGKFCVYLI